MEWYESQCCIIPVGVVAVIVALVIKGLFDEHQHTRRYINQTEDRRKIIRKLYADQSADANWEHMALVINHAGFKDKKGQEFTDQMIKEEHAHMTMLDLDITRVDQG